MSVHAVSLLDLDLGARLSACWPACARCGSDAPTESPAGLAGTYHVIGRDGSRRALYGESDVPWTCPECGCTVIALSLAEQAAYESRMRERSPMADERIEDCEIEEER